MWAGEFRVLIDMKRHALTLTRRQSLFVSSMLKRKDKFQNLGKLMKNLILALFLAASAAPAIRVSAQVPAPQKEQARVSVTLVGEVNKPGVYQLLPDETFPELIKRAGDLSSAADKISLLRTGVMISIPLDVEAAKKLKLREGDVIVASKKLRRVVVIGAVKSPKSYDLSETDATSVRAAIALAGDLDVDLEKYVPLIVVGHQNADGKLEGTKRYILPRDADELEASAPLQAGDAVYVLRVPKSLANKPRANLQLLNAA